MAIWKKLSLWFMGAVLVIVGGCAALLDRLGDQLCATTVIDQFESPSGKQKVVVFQVDCGATTDFNSHVSIVPADTDTTRANDLPQSFFAADGNRGRAPAGKAGGPEVRVFWKDDRHLEIQHHANVRIIRAKSEYQGVIIDYTVFR